MPKHEPYRTCLVTGEEHPQHNLLRFVLSPDRVVVPDIKANLPGRGMWIFPRKIYVEDACKRQLFAKAARQKVKTDNMLPELVAELLKKRASAYIERAQMAGELVTGFEKVLALVKADEAAVLIHSEDAADDGINKLSSYAQAVRIIRFCTREELAKLLNKPNPVHIAIKKGGISTAFLKAYERWAGFHG